MALFRLPARSLLGALIALALFLAGFLAGLLPARQAMAQQVAPDPATLCAFRPQSPPCDALYQQALSQPGQPAAEAVKAAMENYGRYVKGAKGTLTDQDRRFLADNAIALPPGDLQPEDLAGLDAVINDPALAADKDALVRAVNNFLSRAVQAELFCGFNQCADASSSGAMAAK